MAFEVTILGNSSASPTNTRHPSGQYVHILDHHLLIDCGEGTQMQMQRYKIKKSRISQIYISHIHGDHILGLPGLLLSMNLLRRETPIDIYGPPELFTILDTIFNLSETTFHYKLNYHPLVVDKKTLIYENMYYSVSAFPLYHRIPTFGFIIRERSKMRRLNAEACERHKIPFTHYSDLKMGKDYVSPDGKLQVKNEELTFAPGLPIAYAYSSDTIFDERIIRSVEDADILYHEATFLHDKLPRAVETMHTTAKQAGIIARKANVKKLIIGHFSSRYEDLEPLRAEASTEFPNTEIAEEGKKFVME